MKLKTEQEIEEYAKQVFEQELKPYSNYVNRLNDLFCKYVGYHHGVFVQTICNLTVQHQREQAQQDLLSQASEGFKEYIEKFQDWMLVQPEIANHCKLIVLNAWQESRLSIVKEVEALQKENVELISLVVKIRDTIEKNHPEYFNDWVGEFVHSPVVCLERVYLLLKGEAK